MNGGRGGASGKSGGKKAAEERKKISPWRRRGGESGAARGRENGRVEYLGIFASQGLPRCAGKHGWWWWWEELALWRRSIKPDFVNLGNRISAATVFPKLQGGGGGGA